MMQLNAQLQTHDKFINISNKDSVFTHFVQYKERIKDGIRIRIISEYSFSENSEGLFTPRTITI